MTNSVPHGSSGAPPLGTYNTIPGSGSSMFRRSSYASVLSGTANSSNAQPRSGAFSHLINPNSASGQSQHPSLSHSRHLSRSGESEGYYNSMPGSWGRSGQLQSYTGPFGHGGNGFGVYGQEKPIFIPSYLQGSSYGDKLEEEYRNRQNAQRDGRSNHSSNAGSLSTSSSSVNLPKMVPSHRGMTHDIIERAPVFAEENMAPLPTRWNEADKYNGLEVLADGLEVRFSGMSKAHDEAAAIRSDHPMPKNGGIYYFEVTIVSRGKDGFIGIGFSGPKVPLNRLPGWEQESWGYHGDDGLSFACTASGKQYGPKFSTLDVIGCGINFRTNCAFFTKNGVDLGIAFKEIRGDRLYPSVGMKKPGEHLRVNFGQSPFVYDIDGMMQREKESIYATINKTPATSLQPGLDETALIHQLIAQYLAHDGYVETARAFAEEVRAEAKALSNGKESSVKDLDPQEDLEAIQRQKIRSAILEGDIDKALKYTAAYYPSVLRNNESIYFKLRCRKFIEMIRRCSELQSTAASGKRTNATNGHSADDYDVFDHQMELDEQLNGGGEWERMDTEEADISAKHSALLQETLQYGQELQSEFSGDPRREIKKALEDTFALIAYTNVQDSHLGHLLEPSGRVPVAEELNSAILVSLGKSSSAALERVCQQTEALIDMISYDGGTPSFINVRRDFLSQSPKDDLGPHL